MNFEAYYRSYITDTNVSEDGIPLLVNCVGVYNFPTALSTDDTRNDWYLQIVSKGKLLCDGDVTIGEAQFIIRSPHKRYRYEALDGPARYYCLHFTGYRVNELLNLCGICADTVYTIPRQVLGEIDKEFSKLINELKYKRNLFEEACAAMTSSVLIMLARAIKYYSSNYESDSKANELDISIAIIHQHFAGNLRVGELAALEHMSESRYRKIFGETYGFSPGEYITRLRISRACEFLSMTDVAISEVARICGYPDALYFSRIFSKKMGCSPREYRKANRKSI
ncbi:MAG: helix-turn-helix transcriptional regulator [Clostridia bacterium]|nr:helix-turn-helix transcriptional regulator [Clostridia bacterium]